MPAPRAIFEVTYPDRESLLAKDCILAYHGSRLENFHSILHNGLSPLFAKEVYTIVVYTNLFSLG